MGARDTSRRRGGPRVASLKREPRGTVDSVASLASQHILLHDARAVRDKDTILEHSSGSPPDEVHRPRDFTFLVELQKVLG